MRPLLRLLRDKAGRIVWNGYPTGVAVSWAMHHGGPYLATTNPLHTSVGATAIRRWLRPLTYQSVPGAFLPEELRGETAHVPQRVGGRLPYFRRSDGFPQASDDVWLTGTSISPPPTAGRH